VRPPESAATEERLRWTRPGAYQVAPGVHRIPLPLPSDGLRAVNVYVIEDGGGLLLIDSGWALDVSRRQLQDSLAEIGAGLRDIRRFLVTHMHRDHYTQAVALRELCGATVALGAGEQPSLAVLTGRDARPMTGHAARLVAAGAQQLIDAMVEAGWERPQAGADYADPDEWIAGGRRFEVGGRELEAIETPGHTRGHVVFADWRAGLLFAGDHVLPHITPSIGFEPAPPPLPLGDYLESLRLVRAMPDLRLLPAHGPVTDSVHERVDELLEHHDARLARVRAALAGGPRTAYQVAGSLTWTSRDKPLSGLDLINQTLAVSETGSHLDLLAAQGAVTSAMRGAVRYYQLAAGTG
jgi:glyoxylase-like metal-dependent hydrolase (beta-lactamase superfamily II)